MAYRIKYYYQTGNSFGSHRESDTLELSWESKIAARKALQDIKEHWEFARAKDRIRRSGGAFFHNDKDEKTVENACNKSWFVNPSNEKFSEYSHYCLILKTDDGRDWQIFAPWCGYFERLNGAEIIVDAEEDLDSFGELY